MIFRAGAQSPGPCKRCKAPQVRFLPIHHQLLPHANDLHLRLDWEPYALSPHRSLSQVWVQGPFWMTRQVWLPSAARDSYNPLGTSVLKPTKSRHAIMREERLRTESFDAGEKPQISSFCPMARSSRVST